MNGTDSRIKIVKYLRSLNFKPNVFILNHFLLKFKNAELPYVEVKEIGERIIFLTNKYNGNK